MGTFLIRWNAASHLIRKVSIYSIFSPAAWEMISQAAGEHIEVLVPSPFYKNRALENLL